MQKIIGKKKAPHRLLLEAVGHGVIATCACGTWKHTEPMGAAAEALLRAEWRGHIANLGMRRKGPVDPLVASIKKIQRGSLAEHIGKLFKDAIKQRRRATLARKRLEKIEWELFQLVRALAKGREGDKVKDILAEREGGANGPA